MLNSNDIQILKMPLSAPQSRSEVKAHIISKQPCKTSGRFAVRSKTLNRTVLFLLHFQKSRISRANRNVVEDMLHEKYIHGVIC